MEFRRGSITDPSERVRWRVKHHSRGAKAGVVDIVGGRDEEEARWRVQAAYVMPRVIISVERED